MSTAYHGDLLLMGAIYRS